MKPIIDFIYFDLVKVIFNFDHEIGCRQVSSLTGVPVERVRELIFKTGAQDAYETGKISSQQLVDTFAEQSNTLPNLQDFLHAASDIFSVNREIVPLITQLRCISFPMGILSNTCPAHWEFLYQPKHAFLHNFFDKLILSYESGSMKPDRKIYEDAIALAGVPAARIFFIDDRPENVQGAIDAGIDAHLFTSVTDVYPLLQQRGVRLNF